MSRAIRVEHIRHGSNISEKIYTRGKIRLEKSRVKASGEKRGISERSENTTDREKSRAEIEKKIVVIISEQRVRKVV